MLTWKVELIPEAQSDFNRLDGSVKKRILKQLVKLEQNPKYGNRALLTPSAFSLNSFNLTT